MTIRVKVIYSSILQQHTGVGVEELALEEGSDLHALAEEIFKRHPQLLEFLRKIPMLQIYLNGRETLPSSGTLLKDGDEIYISPPLYEGG